jgi:hypothetical protein
MPNAEKKAEEVVSDIPLRLKRLLYDIALLYRTGYLDDLDNNWKHLTSIHDINNKVRDFYCDIPETDDQSAEFDTGFSTGLAFSTLTGDIYDDDRGSEFLLGLLTAYLVNYSKNEFNKLTSGLDETTERFNMKCWRGYILPMYNITPSPIVFSVINRRVLKDDYISIKNYINRIQEFIEEELDMFFGKCVHLQTQIEKEKQALEDANVPGIDPEIVFEALWELKFDKDASASRASSKNIAKQAGKKSRYKRQVTHVLNQLSTQGKNPPNNSDTTISNSQNKDIVYYESGEWNLTNYGVIFGHYSQSETYDIDRIQDCGFICDVGLPPGNPFPETQSKSIADPDLIEDKEPAEDIEETDMREETDIRAGPLTDTWSGSSADRCSYDYRVPRITEAEIDLVKDAVDEYFS